MDTTLLRRVFYPFSCLEIPVNATQYRGTVGNFNNQNFSFNYKSNFNGRITGWLYHIPF